MWVWPGTGDNTESHGQGHVWGERGVWCPRESGCAGWSPTPMCEPDPPSCEPDPPHVSPTPVRQTAGSREGERERGFWAGGPHSPSASPNGVAGRRPGWTRVVVLRGSTQRVGCLGVLVVNMSGKTPRACWEPGRGAAWLGGDQGWRRPDSGLRLTRRRDVSEVVTVLAAVGRRRRVASGLPARPRAGDPAPGQQAGAWGGRDASP